MENLLRMHGMSKHMQYKLAAFRYSVWQ